MGGAATVTATLKAVAEAALPVNLIVLVPLTENMPGGRATKPGDVVTAMNGKTIQVLNNFNKFNINFFICHVDF